MLEVVAAIVLMLIALLALVSIPFIPSTRTLFEETQELRKARAELRDAIVRELRLDWLCEKLNDLILAAQKAMSDALAWDRDCRALHEVTKGKEGGGTFNDYLRARWGDGDNQEKEKQHEHWNRARGLRAGAGPDHRRDGLQ